MKEKSKPLLIYQLSHSLMVTEILALAGAKYASSMPFTWELTDDYETSDIVLWNGILSLKNEEFLTKIIDDIRSRKVLLLIGEAITLFTDHPFVKVPDLGDLKMVEIPGWSALPEDLLMALESCEKKLKNV
jgi:Ni,Fe-hydrogenase III small subunit